MFAIKNIKISNLVKSEKQLENLANEFMVHWALSDCVGAVQLLEIYYDSDFIQLILEY